MCFIETVGISASAIGLKGERVFPYAEECFDCHKFAAIEGYRNMCWQCV